MITNCYTPHVHFWYCPTSYITMFQMGGGNSRAISFIELSCVCYGARVACPPKTDPKYKLGLEQKGLIVTRFRID